MSTTLQRPTQPASSPAGRHRADGREARRVSTRLRKAGTVLATVLLVTAALAFLALAVGPRLLGYQTSTMLTGSMSPLINPGDVVVTVPTPVDQIRAGDIITYHIPVEDQRVETHRVTQITKNPDGTYSVQTKGDANNGIDPWLATITADTVDRHVATIPHLGTAIRALRTPAVLNILMYGAPAILVIGMLASIWTRKPDERSPGDRDPSAAPARSRE